MHSPIFTFHNLKRPHLDGMRAGQWTTYSKEDGMVYLLNAGRYEVANLLEIIICKDIHFDTEAECHRQAHAYYKNFGKSYPYMKEWQACMNGTPIDNSGGVVESQVMRFK